MPRVVIAAGGTAGHVVPALAVAGELRASGIEPLFVGARGRAEEQLVPAAGYEISYLSVQGIDRRNPVRAMSALARAGAAVGGARGLLGRVDADAVLGGGGYVAGPVGMAAVARRTPLVLTEADSHLGLANRLLAPFARRVCLAFPIPGREGDRYAVTGRPVPRDIVEADRDAARKRLGVPPDACCVLVFGGSLGARSVNLAAVEALRDSDAFVLHITGRRDFAEVRDRLGDAQPSYRLFEYVDSLADTLAASDLVVARAGGSIFEIAAAGRPAILVPYPAATAGHQTSNARWMADAGAAVILPDSELTPEGLHGDVQELLGDPKRLEQMSASSRSLARPDAAARIADEVMAAIGRPPGARPSSLTRAASKGGPPAAQPEWFGRRLHFVGIGGAGMSGLALIANALGAEVSGCDRAETPYFAELREAGIEPIIGHDVSHAKDAEVVVSTAIPADLPEVEAVERVLHRSELLEQAAALRRVIAVGGTHGKTTTTAMVAHVLSECGLEPGWAVGAELLDAGGEPRPNARWGSGEWMAVEADESDRSFLRLDPEVAVITNVELDHHATYASEAEVRATFGSFLERVAAGGTVVAWEGAAVEVPAGVHALRFGLGAEADLGARDIQPTASGTRFELMREGRAVTTVDLPAPGEHNVLNALAALGACEVAGCPPAQAAAALAGFHPAGRRFELRGEATGVRVYDDYAHHATEVEATLRAARTLAPQRLVAVFQPHLYSRTLHTHRELGRALALADVVVVLDVYPARELPEGELAGVSGKLVADAAADGAHGRQVWWLPTLPEAEPIVAGLVEHGDVVLTLGAGNVNDLAGGLLERLREPA
jgi:UDP-N-acetylmuramate--L-alanine ligase/undecaprenyldiphospho-muramoylpentapeptide beta-N-acetylglucosaminyltransferase